MTTETQQFLPDFDEIPTSSYRPDQQSSGPGRLLRRVIGIREEILDWAPEERPRFTRLGAIVVNTGLVAALSLLVALNKVVSTPWWLLIPVALFWGFLILSLDGWMITSVHGVLGSAKLRTLIPRLLISILIGAVIAEPLVLWVFQPAIHAEVETERRKALDQYEGRLTKCNPVSGEPVGPECRDYALNIKDTPYATQQESQRMTTERDDLRSKLDDLRRQSAEQEKLALQECTGKSGPQTSGRPGEGPLCRRDQAIADQLHNSRDEQQKILTELDKKVTYDLLLARQLEIAKRLHDKHLNVREQRDSAAAGSSRMETTRNRNRPARQYPGGGRARE
jgi:hypothetical protein